MMRANYIDHTTAELARREHLREMGALDPSETAWLSWVRRAEKELRISSLDGDESEDGYSLDFAYEAWRQGLSAGRYATDVRIARAGLGLSS
jgi:hypothetical protein